jgi:hypothetical protein
LIVYLNLSIPSTFRNPRHTIPLLHALFYLTVALWRLASLVLGS